MNFLIENDIFIDSLTENNLTPLMISAQTNSTYTLNFLLDHGAEINKVNTENALIMAVKNNCINTGEILINRGIDINYQDSSKWTALNFAIRMKSFDFVYILLKNGADVSLDDRYGMIPLHWASKFGLCDIVRILIDYKSDINKRSLEVFFLNLEFFIYNLDIFVISCRVWKL